MNIYQSEIKRLRADARKLTVIAKHLRQSANELGREHKRDQKAAAIRSNFYSKPASIDGETPLVPNVTDPEELFQDQRTIHAARAKKFKNTLEGK